MTNKPYAYVYMNSKTPNISFNQCSIGINASSTDTIATTTATTTTTTVGTTVPIGRTIPITNININTNTTTTNNQNINLPPLHFSCITDCNNSNNNNSESIVSPLSFLSIVSPTTTTQQQQIQSSSSSNTSSLSLSGRSNTTTTSSSTTIANNNNNNNNSNNNNNNNNNNGWIPESDVVKCMYPNCEDDFRTGSALFSFKKRKCRCYKCGFIFCEKHVKQIKETMKLSPSSLTSTQKLASTLSATSPKYQCYTCYNKEMNVINYSFSPHDISPTTIPALLYVTAPPLHIQLSSDENGKNAIITSVEKNSKSQIEYQQLDNGYYLIGINFKSVKDEDFYDIISELKDNKKYPLSLHFSPNLDIDLPDARTPSNSFSKLSPTSPPTPLYIPTSMPISKSLRSSQTVPSDQLIFPNQKNENMLLKPSYSENYTGRSNNNSTTSPPSIILSPTTPKNKLVWTPDSFTDRCMFEGCDVKFGYIVRRHHCRNCGKIYCKSHSSIKLKLPGYNEPQRVCTKCYGLISTSTSSIL